MSGSWYWVPWLLIATFMHGCKTARLSTVNERSRPDASQSASSLSHSYTCPNKAVSGASGSGGDWKLIAFDPKLEVMWLFSEEPENGSGRVHRLYNLGLGDRSWTIEGAWKSTPESGQVKFETTKPYECCRQPDGSHLLVHSVTLTARFHQKRTSTLGEIVELVQHPRRQRPSGGADKVLTISDPGAQFFRRYGALYDCTLQALAAASGKIR